MRQFVADQCPHSHIRTNLRIFAPAMLGDRPSYELRVTQVGLSPNVAVAKSRKLLRIRALCVRNPVPCAYGTPGPVRTGPRDLCVRNPRALCVRDPEPCAYETPGPCAYGTSGPVRTGPRALCVRNPVPCAYGTPGPVRTKPPGPVRTKPPGPVRTGPRALCVRDPGPSAYGTPGPVRTGPPGPVRTGPRALCVRDPVPCPYGTPGPVLTGPRAQCVRDPGRRSSPHGETTSKSYSENCPDWYMASGLGDPPTLPSELRCPFAGRSATTPVAWCPPCWCWPGWCVCCVWWPWCPWCADGGAGGAWPCWCFFWRAREFWNQTCVTRLLSPVICAIRSRSWPSGLLSSWKFACSTCSCSSVKVVRTRFAFCFPPLLLSSAENGQSSSSATHTRARSLDDAKHVTAKLIEIDIKLVCFFLSSWF